MCRGRGGQTPVSDLPGLPDGKGETWDDDSRLIAVERSGAAAKSGARAQGIVLTVIDHVGGKEQARILVQTDVLLATITDPPPGGASVEGVSPSHGVKMLLDVEVRRNEVQLRAHDGSGPGTDVAVGLDDFQDALETVLR